ncbi:chemotaxis protein methyltransferase CheR [Sporomusaceae bacterium BoRhaA]|uniref:CheR family methyltransferase n=1 Tax=Pelorhabdus rhamnosifermentans TaxID=2772457 RepID=UPI001C064903|nr:protein-glutamate O-methyltransferase CheR [Pelorhabdus rhamnosifermentans]MBU2699979.1 chemotaxis protein methyltransferase CheR [Pelorhabdus rhamnosifermentans]
MELLTDQEFNELVQFVKQNYGINLAQKRTLVYGRLHHYMVQSGFNSFSEYFRYIVSDHTGKAGSILLDKLTTNHTYFLREPKHFEFLEQEVLPYLSKVEAKHKDLRLWSAGCSTGEEPYTLAMLIDNFFGSNKVGWDTKILATDISTAALKKAQAAMYSSDLLKTLPKNWQTRYFCKVDEEFSVLTKRIREEVIFRRFNLMNAAFPFKKKFHLIFCRNVMIYFDAETRQELVNRFYDNMERGGYLFIGHSESLNRHESKYQFVAPAVYRKE